MKKEKVKYIAIVVSFVMLLTCIIPILKVIAYSIGNGNNFINMDVTNSLGFTINSVTVNGSEWTSSNDEFHTTDDKYHIEITVSSNDVTGDIAPRLQYGGNWNDYITSSVNHNGNAHTFTLDLLDTAHQGFLGLELLEGFYEPEEAKFDGRSVVVWSCGNGVCYHKFDKIPDFNDGKSTFYKDTLITADNKAGYTFDVHATYKGWYLTDDFDAWVSDYELATGAEINWNTLNPKLIVGDPNQNVGEFEAGAIESGCVKPEDGAPYTEWNKFEACVNHYAATKGSIWARKLQPVGEPDEVNAYVSYGDRNFKVVIYNSDYKGISMGSLEELSYYPSSWNNPFIMRDEFDISGSSEVKPALMDSILLESTVMIKPLDYNSFKITKIEALDVPADAVTITKVNDEFKLEFSSNFYDNVLFKITDNDGEESYLKIKRYTIDGWVRNRENGSTLVADFYFDNKLSYDDFILTAKVILKDGNIKNVKLMAQNGIDDGLGNIQDGYEVDEEHPEFGNPGKGLKRSTFTYELDGIEEKDIRKIYLNAEYKGSTNKVYAGSYVGSGEGVLANLYPGEE